MWHLRKSSAVCLTLFFFSSLSVFATTWQVGTCNDVIANFNTIQAAVNGSNGGDTINICPDTYPEQVTIGKSLTLQAVSLPQNDGNLVVIAVPTGGVTANATRLNGGAVAAQIFVSNAGGVTVSGLTVDAQGNGLSGCGTDMIGIYFQNASGTLTGNAVLNDALDTADNGCQDGEGIFVETGSGGTSTVAVSQNIVANYQKNGITGNRAGTTLTVSKNSVVGQGPTTGAAENGIQIGFGAAGTVSDNTVSDDVWVGSGFAASGILVYASASVSITSNQVNNAQLGIATASDPTSGVANHTTISGNTVNAPNVFDGIDVCSNGNTISSNTVNGATESGVHLDDTCGTTGNNNMVTNDTINLACAGVLKGLNTTTNTITGVTYYSVVYQHPSGETCTPTPPSEQAKKAQRRVQPVRP